MKAEYKGKKWDKEVKNIQKYVKEVKDINCNEKNIIQDFLDNNANDYLRLYSSLYLEYQVVASQYYLQEINNEIIKYIYLSGYSLFVSYCLWEKGVRTLYNQDVCDWIAEKNLKEIDNALFMLIATENIDDINIEKLNNHLIMLVYHQKYDQAKLLLEQLPEAPKQSLYYTHPAFLKEIYRAIIEHDEKRFNEELVKRIKKYRRNMVGYSLIIDVVSVALIKIAEREGLHCTVDVIEIPKIFFDDSCKIDTNEVKLPFYDEFLKLNLI